MTRERETDGRYIQRDYFEGEMWTCVRMGRAIGQDVDLVRTSLAGLRERDRVPSHPTERVQDDVASASLSNLVCNRLGCDTIPALLVQ